MYFTHAAVVSLPENAAVACWGVFLGLSEQHVRSQYQQPDRDPFACFGSVAAATAYLNEAKASGLLRPE
jgi:hypothetical protein